MAVGRKYLIDTNILLRLSRQTDPQHLLVKSALDELNRQAAEFYFALQNMAEFWNACTRPTPQNGFGLTGAEAEREATAIERVMILLPDTHQVYSIWRQLVVSHHVRGVQVHDARLVAVMVAHGVTHILTLNQADFTRYAHIEAVHPRQLQAATP